MGFMEGKSLFRLCSIKLCISPNFKSDMMRQQLSSGYEPISADDQNRTKQSRFTLPSATVLGRV